MRIISWNLHGANVPGRATSEQLKRAWDYMRELNTDLILAQEATAAGLPDWLKDGWTLLAGEKGRFRKSWDWGSVIAARNEMELTADEDALSDSSLAQLYDLVMVGKCRLGSESILVASVHTVAMKARDWMRDHAKELELTDLEFTGLQRPDSKEVPYVNDLAFEALARTIGDDRFVVGGDWNTSRNFAGGPEFFVRAATRSWVGCTPEPEQQSYFGRNTVGAYQLDHIFVDSTTASLVTSAEVHVNELVHQVSDHAPIVVDLRVER